MKPLSKVLLTLSLTVLFLGAIACLLAYVVGGRDLSRLDIDTAYEQKVYVAESGEIINNVVFDVDRHNVIVKKSSSAGSITVEYSENEYDIFKPTVKNGTFEFTNKQLKNMFFRQFCLLFDRKNPDERKIVVTVPKSFDGNMKIRTSKGDIDISASMVFTNLDLDVSSGNVYIENINADTARIDVKTGTLEIDGGSYKKLDVIISNPAVYVPVEIATETPSSGETPSSEETSLPEETPSSGEDPLDDETPLPETTSSPDETPSAEETPSPDETPLPTPTETVKPKPTKVPTVLSVDVDFTFENLYVDDFSIIAYNTNIVGKFARSSKYYSIKTNNTESSNVATNENITASGNIEINQNGGSTNIEFR